ncbi:MAG TPA: Gfo/Idh/MocA family oxidoreductase [Gaiellaceae bacterium]|nr:Gfo/Idh/MocA family oxidoreductase [Gaiellaceae bacterium]
MSYEPVRWGILSTAHINRLVIPPARESPKVDLVAIASRTRDAADQYATKWEIPRAHGSYEALLADPDVEAIYISLPNSLHVEWSINALEAGKHVLCEKPFEQRPERVEEAFDVAERQGLQLTEAFMYRHHPQTAKLIELVEGGAIGTLQAIRAAFSYALYDVDNVRLRTDVEGGALMDVGCYCVHSSRLLGGEPDRVYAEQVVGPTGVDVRFHGTMRFPSGVVSQWDCGMVMAERDELEAIGDTGSLFLDDPYHCDVPGIELRRDGETERIEIEPADPYGLELENVSDAIRGEREPLLGREDAVAQAATIAALRRSAESGTPEVL